MKANTSNFTDITFVTSDLSGANISECVFTDVEFNNCSLEGLLVNGSIFKKCSFNKNYAAGWKTINRDCLIDSCSLKNMVLIGSQIKVRYYNSTFEEVNTEDCNFEFDVALQNPSN